MCVMLTYGTMMGVGLWEQDDEGKTETKTAKTPARRVIKTVHDDIQTVLSVSRLLNSYHSL